MQSDPAMFLAWRQTKRPALPNLLEFADHHIDFRIIINIFIVFQFSGINVCIVNDKIISQISWTMFEVLNVGKPFERTWPNNETITKMY